MELETIIITGIALVWAVVWGIYTRPRRKAKKSTDKTQLDPKPKERISKKPTPPLLLRSGSEVMENLSREEGIKMLKERGVFDSEWNKPGKGIEHEYEETIRGGKKLVIDHATGLTWQQWGSNTGRKYTEAEEFIESLNEQKYAGFNDWRLPTLEEAMSLMKPKKNEYGLYVDPVFDSMQTWIWTADKARAMWEWIVDFHDGNFCSHSHGLDPTAPVYVRAVR